MGKKISKKCCQCNQVKSMSVYRIRCPECLQYNKKQRWENKKQEICNNPEDRKYLISIPVKGKWIGESSILVYVTPTEYYGGVLGVELMREYLHPRFDKTIGKDTNARKYKSRHKIRYIGEGAKSFKDAETLEKLGNVWNDTEFNKYYEEIKRLQEALDNKEITYSEFKKQLKRLTTDKYKGLKITEFTGQNEALGIKYRSFDEQREKEQSKRERYTNEELIEEDAYNELDEEDE